MFTHLVLDNIKLDYRRIGARAINRAAQRYHHEMGGGFWPFFLYLCNHIFDISDRDRDAARHNIELDIARVCIDYSDPTGDQAVRNVLRERALKRRVAEDTAGVPSVSAPSPQRHAEAPPHIYG